MSANTPAISTPKRAGSHFVACTLAARMFVGAKAASSSKRRTLNVLATSNCEATMQDHGLRAFKTKAFTFYPYVCFYLRYHSRATIH
jgi:hypothetical protein